MLEHKPLPSSSGHEVSAVTYLFVQPQLEPLVSCASLSHRPWLFMWLLGIRTQVLVLAELVLLPSEPSPETHGVWYGTSPLGIHCIIILGPLLTLGAPDNLPHPYPKWKKDMKLGSAFPPLRRT